MSVGSLKQVDLIKSVDDLSTVPYLNLGQEIQSKKNLMRYYILVTKLISKKATITDGKAMPLPHSSHVNILVDDVDLDFPRPKMLTFPSSGQMVSRFGYDLEQLRLDIEQQFVRIIKSIRAELGLEGDDAKIKPESLGIGSKGEEIDVNPRDPGPFILGFAKALGVGKYSDAEELPTQTVGGKKDIISYPIDLPYFK